MLDFVRFQQQLRGFAAYQQQRRDWLQEKLQAALDAWQQVDDVRQLLAEVDRVRPSWLVARPLGKRLQERVVVPERPAQVTVVAADGSQIFPDRHVEPPCFLLNVGRVAFQLGTYEPVRLESIPRFYFRQEDVQDLLDERMETVSAEIVSALRDAFELEMLLELARDVRRDDRPLVALLDGTLIRWMIRRLHQRELEEELVRRYVYLLEQFQEAGIPVASYISMPGGAEVVNLLRVARGECSPDPPALLLDGLTDRLLFGHLLRPGERSGLFLSGSHIQQAYTRHRIVYTYVAVPGPYGMAEIARVEFPAWVAENSDWVDLVHGVLLKECEKGGGYPMVLTEAHEQAVIRASEREVFYELISRQLRQQRLPVTQSRKQASKRRPVL